jgi:hypothetical protein
VDIDPYVTEGSRLINPGVPFGLTNGWTLDTLASQWLSPQQSYSKTSDPAGEYIYEDTFNLTGLNLSTVDITGKWTADNYGYIVVNGVQVTAGESGNIADTTGQFEHYFNFALTSSNTDFVSGVNTIEFVVMNNSNGSPNSTGLNVDIESKTANVTPEPGSFALMGLGLGTLGLAARKWQRR